MRSCKNSIRALTFTKRNAMFLKLEQFINCCRTLLYFYLGVKLFKKISFLCAIWSCYLSSLTWKNTKFAQWPKKNLVRKKKHNFYNIVCRKIREVEFYSKWTISNRRREAGSYKNHFQLYSVNNTMYIFITQRVAKNTRACIVQLPTVSTVL